MKQLTDRLMEVSQQSLPARNPPPFVVHPTPADHADQLAMCNAVRGAGYWVPWQDAAMV